MKLYLSLLYVVYYIFLHTCDVEAGILECEEDVDCVASGASCVDSLCECPSGKVFSSNGTLCLNYVTEYGAACDDTNQCAWLLGQSTCTSGVCICSDGWRWYQGKCIEKKSYGESCSSDLQCYNGYMHFAMACKGGYCECNDGYYLRGNYDCRPIAYNVSDECALDSDCEASDTVCTNARCAISTGAAFVVAPATIYTKAEPTSPTFRDSVSCISDADCEEITDSVCSPLTKECICKRGYFYDDTLSTTSCVGELGVDIGCTSDSDCLIKSSTCSAGACFCPTYRFYGTENRKCYKSMTQTNFNCTSNEWCYALGTNAYCNSNGSCACSSGFEMDENYVCQASGDNGESSECETDSDCSVSNSQCVDYSCVCEDGYREENNRCLPNIGTACSSSSQCTITDSTCANGVCSCQDGYVASSSTSCLKVVSSINGTCEEDVQCTASLTNTQCSDGFCTCADNYVEKNDTCYENKSMESYCTTSQQCSVILGGSVQCINSKCQCAVGYETAEDGTGCRTSGVALPTVSLLCMGFVILNRLFD